MLYRMKFVLGIILDSEGAFDNISICSTEAIVEAMKKFPLLQHGLLKKMIIDATLMT